LYPRTYFLVALRRRTAVVAGYQLPTLRHHEPGQQLATRTGAAERYLEQEFKKERAKRDTRQRQHPAFYAVVIITQYCGLAHLVPSPSLRRVSADQPSLNPHDFPSPPIPSPSTTFSSSLHGSFPHPSFRLLWLPIYSLLPTLQNGNWRVQLKEIEPFGNL
jgi:hypothetical protein